MEKSLIEMFNDLKEDYWRVHSVPYTFRSICTKTLKYLDTNHDSINDLRTYHDDIKKEIIAAQHNVNRSIDFASKVAEAEVYIQLLSMLKKIKKIPETTIATPDFECEIESEDGEAITFYIELKTFDFSNNSIAVREVANDDITTAIALKETIKEEHLKNRSEEERVICATAEREVSPFGQTGHDIDKPILTLIDKLLRRVKSLYNEKQYQKGLTIPMYNLSTLSEGIIKKQDICPYMNDRGTGSQKTIRSGVLWHLMFGGKDHNIFGYHRFEGSGNLEGKMEGNGFITENTDLVQLYPKKYEIPACIFYKRTDDNTDAFYGLYKSSYNKGKHNDHTLTSILYAICKHSYNDQNNSYYHTLTTT